MQSIWKTTTNNKGKEYSIKLRINKEVLLIFSCTCKYGSFYRFTKKNIKEKKELCRHIVKAYSEETKQSYEQARQTLIKQGILNKNHIKKI